MKENNRYALCEYFGRINRTYNTEEEYQELLKIINSNNRKLNQKFFFGNVSRKNVNNQIVATIHVYGRLTEKMKLTELDAMTSGMDYRTLLMSYSNKLRKNNPFNPDINVMYFETKDKGSEKPNETHYDIGVKYIPVLYIDDKKFFDINFVRECIRIAIMSKDMDFFHRLIKNFITYKKSGEEVDHLRYILNLYLVKCATDNELYYAAERLYSSLVYERNKDGEIMYDNDGKVLKNYRRTRDFAMFLKYYKSEKPVPTEFNTCEKRLVL